MINNVILVGRLTKDIVVKKTPSGKSVCRFTLAVDRRKSNDNQQTADFIQCVAWEKATDILARYTHKGSQIGIEGSIQTGSYEQDGKKTYTTEVVARSITLLGSKSEQTQETTVSDDLTIDYSDMPF